jgi:hypothetical protein
MDLESSAEVEITSEDPAHPIEAALLLGRGRGWKASQPGKQTLRILFDSPQEIRRVYLVFTEDEKTRTQEFVLRWSAGKGETFREIVRQQYNFAPGSSEVEDYAVELHRVKILELEIIPSISGGDGRASLAELRLR